jgi:hypothetical protein
MKKYFLISLLCIAAFAGQGQVLRINKYLVDSVGGDGFWRLYKDTTHTGQWGLIGGSGGGVSGNYLKNGLQLLL